MTALFSWADVDGDGRLDLAAVSSEGALQLLVSTGDGSFEDVTARAGLAEVGNAALALWADYDADGRLDLFVGARSGPSRLFHNEGGQFTDMSAGSGLVSEGAVQSAQWLDHDGDGRLDLFVATAEESEHCTTLFRGVEGGFFERSELPPLAGAGEVSVPGGPIGEPPAPTLSDAPEIEGGMRGRATTDGSTVVSSTGSRAPIVIAPGGGTSSTSSIGLIASCLPAIRDQANPGACLQASSTPTLGRLYPISANLFVAALGNVGIGTTTPSARLEVAGTARVTDTLTLAPAGDTALDVSTGSIYKGGALFLHTKGGSGNTALGREALVSVTSGQRNTASGSEALRSNTTGNGNTASGERALYSNTDGRYNTASGVEALRSNTTGYYNTASGVHALRNNTAGQRNTASGVFALRSNTTGDNNTASGSYALHNNTFGSRNTASGAGALRSNTYGSYNTASGFEALRSNTGGRYNMASGAFALSSNTSGDGNTASGERALSSNTTGGGNTASGKRALSSNTTGVQNTASGAYALSSNTTGNSNTASGNVALSSNTIGEGNTASGVLALLSNTIGDYNTASGAGALRLNTTGNRNAASGANALDWNSTGSYNTASGYGALRTNTTGNRNIALGYRAGVNLTTGSDNVAIGNLGVAAESATVRLGTAGTHTRAFLAGIRGVTTGVADGIPVLIDSAGQLGTVSSSRRFKEDIRDMGDRTERLLQLRPVVFRYKPEVQSGERPLEYGLIAEEVAEAFPELVVNDDDGKPFTVKYHLLSAMLLNELQELDERFEAREGDHARELEELEERLAALEAWKQRAAATAAAEPR